MVEVIRIFAEKQSQQITLGDIADIVHEFFEVLEMQDLALFELHNSLDLLIDVLLLGGKVRIDSK